jgi:cytochrome b involved in lipid metabolism
MGQHTKVSELPLSEIIVTLALLVIHHLTILVTFIVLDTVYQCRKPIQMSHRTMLADKKLRSMTFDEFNEAVKQNKKYLLFDEYVIDVESFQGEHPGGSAMLEHHIGRSIGRYFYGAYKLEWTMRTHTHSKFAAKVMAKLAIAKIDLGSNDMIKNKIQNDYQIQNPNFIFNFKQRTKLMRKIYRIEMENQELMVKNISPDTSLFGRSMLVVSMKNYVSRYYTICHCMWSDIYQEYISAMKAALNHGIYNRKYGSLEEYQEMASGKFEFIMKYYPDTDEGLSYQIKKSRPESEYYISGPIDQGIKINGGLNIFI